MLEEALEKLSLVEQDIEDKLLYNSLISNSCTSSCMKPAITA